MKRFLCVCISALLCLLAGCASHDPAGADTPVPEPGSAVQSGVPSDGASMPEPQQEAGLSEELSRAQSQIDVFSEILDALIADDGEYVPRSEQE